MESICKVLIMTAVTIEKEAVLAGLQDKVHAAGLNVFEVKLAGVGPAAAATNTAMALAKAEYDLVISLGIGGGFPGQAEVGSVVVATDIIAADLGAETPEGFASLDELGFGKTRFQCEPELVGRLTEALCASGLPAQAGPALTVSTVTGTAKSAERLAARIPGAAAEAMEGFGVALAAYMKGIPALEIRTISNLVGPRDREAWRIKEALALLGKVGLVISEVLTCK